jgi:membrane protease YdiL (CAAX protease family)
MSDTDEGPVVRVAGWYPDPFGRAPFRWWDGERWSEYAGDGQAVEWDAAPTDAVAAPSPGLPGVGVALLGTAIGFGLAFAISALLTAVDKPGGRPALLGLSELGLWTGLVGACVYVSRRRGTGSLVRDYGFRFRWSDLGLGLAGALVGRMVAALVLSPIPFPSRRLSDVDRSILHDGTHGAFAWIVLVVVTCVGAPLVEELFFRGLLQTRLVGRFGPVLGIVGTSLLFGSAHLVAWNGVETLAYGWAVAGGGLVLGTIRHYSGRLGTSIVAHALFNSVAMLALAFLG